MKNEQIQGFTDVKDAVLNATEELMKDHTSSRANDEAIVGILF